MPGGRGSLGGGSNRDKGRNRGSGKLASLCLRLLAEVSQFQNEITAVEKNRDRLGIAPHELGLDGPSRLIRPFVDLHLAEGKGKRKSEDEQKKKTGRGFHGKVF